MDGESGRSAIKGKVVLANCLLTYHHRNPRSESQKTGTHAFRIEVAKRLLEMIRTYLKITDWDRSAINVE